MTKEMEIISNKTQDEPYQVMFNKLKKEIMIGHQDIIQEKVISLDGIRRTLNFDGN